MRIVDATRAFRAGLITEQEWRERLRLEAFILLGLAAWARREQQRRREVSRA